MTPLSEDTYNIPEQQEELKTDEDNNLEMEPNYAPFAEDDQDNPYSEEERDDYYKEAEDGNPFVDYAK